MKTISVLQFRFLVLSGACAWLTAVSFAADAPETATLSPPALPTANVTQPAETEPPKGEAPEAPAADAVPAMPPDTPQSAEETIHRARQFLGGDEALDRVESIRFRGSLVMDDGTSGDVEIIVKKPMRQHVTITIGSNREVTVLDEYEAWRRVERIGPDGGWQMTLLDANEVRTLRANAFENIAFYKGIESVGGRVEFLGDAIKEGIPCVAVAFIHPRDIRFVRYFNASTGQLVVTETNAGGEIRESGEIWVRGVRFPKELLNTSGNSSNTVIFSSITLNEEFPDSMFEVPMISPGD